MSYDSARGVTVLFGGADVYSMTSPDTFPGGVFGDTWEHDGQTWRRVATTGPSPRFSHAMCFDSVRGVTVLFGGTPDNRDALGDTWEWNGISWTQVASTGPEPLFNHAMAFDAARGVSLLHGGTAGSGSVRARTWTWNGSTWVDVSASPTPGARALHSMAYDSNREVVVLFGRDFSSNTPDDTWEWNGTAWNQVSIAGPSRRVETAMVYDPARAATLLYGGGFINGDEVSQLWKWDGADWTLLGDQGPSRRQAHAMVFDTQRGAALLFGGSDSSGVEFPAKGDTWILDNFGWSRLPSYSPAARRDHAMAYDATRDAVAIFGGTLQDSSSVSGFSMRRGTQWFTAPGAGPSPRDLAAMAFDSDRGVLVLFGGRYQGSALSDTWDWDGAAWTQVPAGGPASSGCLMSYDIARARMILLETGGQRRTFERIGAGAWAQAAVNAPGLNSAPSLLYHDSRGHVLLVAADIRRWTGSQWELVAASAPQAASRGYAVYDRDRNTVVLKQNSAVQEWVGGAWTSIPASGGPDTASAAMAYDSARQKSVLFGGSYGGYLRDLTWEWDGANWTRSSARSIEPRTGAAMVYDEARGVYVCFGGDSDSFVGGCYSDTWEFDGHEWQQRQAVGPGARRDAQMVFDEQRGVCVLWDGQPCGGGDSGRGPWEWDGTAWTEFGQAPPFGPASMVYHPGLASVIFFSSSGVHSWDGAGFRQISPNNASTSGRIAYDVWREVVVEYDLDFTRTREWNGNEWVVRSDDGPVTVQSLYDFSLIFDHALGKVLLIGRNGFPGPGSDRFLTTWSWDGVAWTERPIDRFIRPLTGAAAAYAQSSDQLMLLGGTVDEEVSAELWLIERAGPRIVGLPTSQNVASGDPVTLLVVTAATEPVEYQWFRNNVAVPGALQSSYSFTASVETIGSYHVQVMNECGEVVSPDACVTLIDRPFITQSPASIEVCSGTTATLSVGVDPELGPFTYRWRRDGLLWQFQSGQTLVTSSAGVYDALVTQVASGCTFVSESALVEFTRLPGDVDLDGVTGLLDLSILLSSFGRTNQPRSSGDLDGDEEVDLMDLEILLTDFGSICP